MKPKLLKQLSLLGLGTSIAALPNHLKAADVPISEDITADTTWTADNTYILTDIIYVKDGATLTIDPGTIIEGEAKSAGAFDPGALVITKGSQIMAEGTADNPIVFTSTEDDGSLTEADSGLWGGVIILGSASINTDSGTEFIEGLPTSADGEYGGNDDADSSGVFKYVSIRHGGAAIASDNEINGLTMGGVGSGTTIEYVEVFANADDGFEFFGGTVNTKYLIGAFNQDDTFGWDEGFRGKGQFWFAIQDAISANRGAEMDGGPSSNVQATPYSEPVVYNATFTGSGSDSGNVDSQALKFRENSGGIYANSIFTGFVKGVDIDQGDKNGDPVAQDSEARYTAGTLALKGNIFHDIGTYATLGDIIEISAGSFHDTVEGDLATNGNSFEDPQLAGISRLAGEDLDPRPATDGPAYSNLTALPGDAFFADVDHKGAFGATNWSAGWSKLGEAYSGDIFVPAVVVPVISLNGNANITVVVGETFVDPGATAGVYTNSIVVTGTVDANAEGTYTLTYDVSDDDGNAAESVTRTVEVTSGGTVQITDSITSDTTWNRANTYVLTDIIYVKDGATLTIEPGTVIKGEPKSAGAFDPGALVITRGSKIHAAGTFSKPIIFTSTSDDGTGNLTSADSGLWGGVIILGSATINTDAGTEFIEGLPTSADGEYGGNDDEDNSGILKYVSIRHGGAAIASDNEINGLTMGGVGSGTTIEYVEVFANADDGFEFFGGTVNTKHLVGAFNQDDTFDWDEGFRGKGQFWFAIQDPVSANRGAEMDGGPSSNVEATPFSNPVIYNATFIGSGSASGNTDSQVLKFRENSGGIYANSIFTAFVKGVDVDPGDKNGLAVDEDSEARFNAGTLALKGNIFHDIGSYASLEDLVEIGDTQGKSGDFKANFVSALSTNGNSFVNPLIGGISYDTDEGLDPRPAEGGPAFSGMSDLPSSDSFFEDVTHKGAFGYNNWAEGWTFLAQSGAFGDITTAIHPELSDATALGSDWYDDPSKGYIYWAPGTEWLYQWNLGYLYQEPGTNWFYSVDTGLGWIYIDDNEITADTVGSVKVLNGYVYVEEISGYIYLSTIDNGDGTTTTLFFNTVTQKWGIL